MAKNQDLAKAKNEELSRIVAARHLANRLDTREKLEDAAWLNEQYHVHNRTAEEMAAEIGCAIATVTDALRRLSIPVRTPEETRRLRGQISGSRTEYPQLYDEAWLRDRYIDKDMTVAEIAVELGCSTGVVWKAVDRSKLPKRKERRKNRLRSDAIPQLHDREWLHREFILKNRTTKDIAAELNCKMSSVASSVSRLRITKFPGRTRVKLDKTLPAGIKRKNGYLQEYVPLHPVADERGYVLQHRLVVERIIGRNLTAIEEVHHIDGRRERNEESNLILMPDFRTHRLFELNPPPWVPRCGCCAKPRPDLVTARPSWVPLEYNHELTYSSGPPVTDDFVI